MTVLTQALRDSVVVPTHLGEDGSWRMSFVFSVEFQGFAGHFPGNPILPGVVQIMAAALCASAGRTTRIQGLTRTKFLRVIAPGERVCVRAVPKAVNKAAVFLTVDDEMAATMILTFDLEEDEE